MGNATPITWQLIDALKQRLQGITVANGYRTDIGTDVTTERVQWGDGAAHLAIFTLGIKKGDGDNATRRVRTLTLSIEPSVPTTVQADGSTDAQQRMHQIIADVEDALVAPDAVTVPGALKVRVAEVQVVDEPEGILAIVAAILVDVEYLP